MKNNTNNENIFQKKIEGFSRLLHDDKIELLKTKKLLTEKQISLLKIESKNFDIYKRMSENVFSIYNLPYSLLPNMLVDGNNYLVPMVTEESSVVAAAAKATSFWYDRGGFKSKILSTNKLGHIHFIWKNNYQQLEKIFPKLKEFIMTNLVFSLKNMSERGGGIKEIKLLNKKDITPGLCQLELSINTCDSMGANFINSILEEISSYIQVFMKDNNLDDNIEILMSIVSNFSPESLVISSIECDIKDLNYVKELNPHKFIEKFQLAIKIAEKDIKRAVTHNKGIFNGIDAVALATGNDFRAMEACGHSYAYTKKYSFSLTKLTIDKNKFKYEIKVPLVLGVVGGITEFHPQVKNSLSILGNPDAKELMSITASVGLASNFAAVSALISEGIQSGHMKLHKRKIMYTGSTSR